MTAKDAMKCVSLLEKAFGWKVWFYTMYISGKEEWLYDVKLAGSRFDDDLSPRVLRHGNVLHGSLFHQGGRRQAFRRACVQLAGRRIQARLREGRRGMEGA